MTHEQVARLLEGAGLSVPSAKKMALTLCDWNEKAVKKEREDCAELVASMAGGAGSYGKGHEFTDSPHAKVYLDLAERIRTRRR